MADLALRFGKDMLVVSSPIQEALRRAGIESARDQALALLVEPETIEEAYRMETVAGPQCMVTPVADFTPARLVAVGAEGKGEAAGRGGPCGHGGVQAPAYARGDRSLRSAAGSRLQGVACGKSRPVRSCGAIVRWPRFRRVLFERVHDGR